MSEQILIILKQRLDNLAAHGNLDAETRRNALKEELQFYVLNFIYHHPEYQTWIMYGGSALRIIHGLDRMSVDLDFEISQAITEKFLENLKKEVENYFNNTYGAGTNFLTTKITSGRGLLLKFQIGDELSFGHPSKQVHVKIDLNHFVAPKTVIERRPINHGQLSFIVITYNMSALMASKLAAIFLRRTRGVGKAIYEEKGRDIYDLLWYMNKKIVPDFDYLKAKDVEEVKDLRTLFDKLTIKINSVSKENLKQDLTPLFLDRIYIENWLANWHESYLQLLDDYKIRIVKELESIGVYRDFKSDNFSFIYSYKIEDAESAQIEYNLSGSWIMREADLELKIDKKIEDKIEFFGMRQNSRHDPKNTLKRYATLFHQKTEKYFKKTNRIMLGDSIVTKVIRMTSENLNQKEQIVLNKSALISCELDDLLK